ncbi:MAG: glycosyl hydrolase [Fimbriimonadaceae bacterium]
MLLASLLLAIVSSSPAPKPGYVDSLAEGFRNPPASAKPHTWWHWMDGNVTKEGITADLEAMKKVGIGGAQMFTVSQGIPPGPAGYMSPLWRELTTFAIKEAGRLGIELCIHNCAGWSSSGGPWVAPENAMQVVAWSERKVRGPARFSEILPPAKAPFVYASVPYYRDIAVFGFRTPAEGDAGKADPQLLGKSGVHRMDGLEPNLTPTPAGLAIPKDGLVNLTSKLEADGRLTWDVPEGDWTILRMGHVPTGKNNHPAPPEGDGLEVDKLSREALDAFWAGMMAKVIADAGPLAGKVLNNALVDSYEVGGQNWTPRFREEFQRRRGYDPLPYLPTIAGLLIESKEDTERFLWDFRRTIADLFADNYYGYFGELSRKAGLQFSTEPYGNGGFDNIQVGGKSDIPMGEFWIGGGTLETTKLASSVGHVYGRPVVGAEAFTADDVRGKWLEEPYTAKALGDLVFTNGINRYIFHRYAHQPWMNLKPGMTMGPWGTHLERTQTWWTEAATWLKYVARCQFLLQRGKFVADALYFYGEGAPVDLPYRPSLKPAMPAGYDYDGADATVILERLRVRNGRLLLPDGMSYSVLVLPESRFMTSKMVARIAELVRAGAVVVGPKPTMSPSLADSPKGDAEVKRIADEVWGIGEIGKAGVRDLGKGTVFWGATLAEVFERLEIAPDFEYRSLTGGSKLVYIHRKIDGADVYFVSNQQYQPTEADVTFRIKGKAPEFWRADSGVIEPAAVYREEKGRTVVPLRLGPAESVFVVFRGKPKVDHLTSFAPVRAKQSMPKVPQIAIKSARYETADGRGADVTAIVAQLVKQGQFEIPATNGLFGDPVVNVVKRLRIDYLVDGKPKSKMVNENETLVLEDLPPVKPAGFEIALAGSRYTLTPWKPGSYVGATSRGRQIKILVKESPVILALGGPWDLRFPPGWGAPLSVKLPRLISWPDHANPGVRYFSGSANYSREFSVGPGVIGKDRTIVLDLGKVKNFATVKLNGKALGVLWKEPFAVDIGKAVLPGKNRLEIKVTNLWPNRIIGDEQLPPDVEWNGASLKAWPQWLVKGEPRPKTGRFTFTTWRFWNKDSPLLESGLIGPVVIRSARRVEVRL